MTMVTEYGGYGWSRIAPNEYLMSLYDTKFDKRYDAYWKPYYTYNNSAFDFSKVAYKYGDTIKPNTPNLSYTTGNNFLMYCNVSCKKYWDWTKVASITTEANNIMIYRYAEVYLMAAEAYLKSGDMAKARYYINLLRMNRIASGAPNRVVVTVDDQTILDEHAREMAFEGRRWFLLKRFGKLIDQVRLHGGQSNFRGLQPADPAFPNDPVKCIIPDYFSARINIQDFHVRWPIPQAEIDAMGKTFPQNTGY